MKKREIFKIDGDNIKRKRKHCPKCGPGVFLAEHKDRSSCGKCGYTEFKGKNNRIEPSKENKTEGKKPEQEKTEDKEPKREEQQDEVEKENPTEKNPEEHKENKE